MPAPFLLSHDKQRMIDYIPQMDTEIQLLQQGQDLSEAQAYACFSRLLLGDLNDETIIRLLLALKSKGESVTEIIGAARAMRDAMTPFDAPDNAMDVCGTGGDGLNTYNISTTAAIVLAACGVPVVKHGNRAVSSRSGSSDILAELGISLGDNHDILKRSLEEVGICYLAAPLFHPAMRHAASARKQIKSRTIFNLLGPLCNPAQVRYQLLGVYDKALCLPLAQTLQQLGSLAAAVVHGADGLDELTVTGPSHVAQLLEGAIHSYDVLPKNAGIALHSLIDLQGGSAKDNAAALLRVLEGEQGAYRDAVLMNVTGALIVSDKVDDPISGALLAAEAIDSGRAMATLHRWRESMR